MIDSNNPSDSNVPPPNGSDPLAAIRELDDTGGKLGPGEISLDKDGEIVRRKLDGPMSFSFRWHETVFNGRVEVAGDKLRLRLLADLQSVPYTSEDAAKRDRLLSLLAEKGCGRAGKLLLLNNYMFSLANDIEMPRSSRSLDTTIVEHIAILVLLAAPHIERLAQLET